MWYTTSMDEHSTLPFTTIAIDTNVCFEVNDTRSHNTPPDREINATTQQMRPFPVSPGVRHFRTF